MISSSLRRIPQILRCHARLCTIVPEQSIQNGIRPQVFQDAQRLHLLARSFATKAPSGDQNPSPSAKFPSQSMRKVTKRKRPLTATYRSTWDETDFPAYAIATCESYDLEKISADHKINETYHVTLVDDVVDNALYVTSRMTPENAESNVISDFFVFSDGVVVFWNVGQGEQDMVLASLREYQTDAYSMALSMEEAEKMPFNFVTSAKSGVKKDKIQLSAAEDVTSNKSVLERYAFSHAIATSVKISVWESELNDQAEPLADIGKDLERGNITWKRKKVLQKIGEFGGLRHSINLTDLLSDDFYWDRPELERHYRQTCSYFTIRRRLDMMDKRLDYCEQLLGVVDNVLAHRHSARLEWLIIWLIVIEVIFDAYHFYDHDKPKPVYIIANETQDDPKSTS
ncbi:putative ACR, yagE family domain-containing protein [Ditylenchus destructor]|nr:putative ACR, yagE family domain-containing protein [Ditylenchus destructor]